VNPSSDPIQNAPPGGQPQVLPPQQSASPSDPAYVQQPAQSQGDDYQRYVSNIDAPAIAEDVDLIEKEWVDKAKDIVERTKHDPRAQSKEITKLRADYLKKRYNRDIKLQKEE
jgi:hypothetical protein